jgi:hypothetical protein
MAVMNKILSWVVENGFGIVVGIWFLSSVVDLSNIAFTVRHTDTETKVSVETPITKEKPEKPKATESGHKATESSPRTTDTPTATW